MGMKNVIYKVILNQRNRLGELNKEIAGEYEDLKDAYINLTHFRMNNKEKYTRYILGHPKWGEDIWKIKYITTLFRR